MEWWNGIEMNRGMEFEMDREMGFEMEKDWEISRGGSFYR